MENYHLGNKWNTSTIYISMWMISVQSYTTDARALSYWRHDSRFIYKTNAGAEIPIFQRSHSQLHWFCLAVQDHAGKQQWAEYCANGIILGNQCKGSMWAEPRAARTEYLWSACSRIAWENKESSENIGSKKSKIDAMILLLSITLGCFMTNHFLLIQ